MSPRLSLSKAFTIPLQINLRLWYDPSVTRIAESYFTLKVNKNSKSSQRQNWMAVSNIMVQTVVTSKHEDCNLVFTNHGKEDGIYPLRTKNTL
jgi:hypothetical protein